MSTVWGQHGSYRDLIRAVGHNAYRARRGSGSFSGGQYAPMPRSPLPVLDAPDPPELQHAQRTFCSDFFSSGNAFFSLPSPKNSPSLDPLAALDLAK